MLRFPPGGVDQATKIRKEAKYNNRHHAPNKAAGGTVEPWFRLSVWTDVARSGETQQDLRRRLVLAAGLHGINLSTDRNAVFWWSTVAALRGRGFLLKKDGYPAEPAEHYSVVFGAEPCTEDVLNFVEAFEGPVQTGEVT